MFASRKRFRHRRGQAGTAMLFYNEIKKYIYILNLRPNVQQYMNDSELTVAVQQLLKSHYL